MRGGTDAGNGGGTQGGGGRGVRGRGTGAKPTATVGGGWGPGGDWRSKKCGEGEKDLLPEEAAVVSWEM